MNHNEDDDGGRIAINPDKFDEPITSFRTAMTMYSTFLITKLPFVIIYLFYIIEILDFLLVSDNLVDSLIILFYTFYYYEASINIDSYEDRLVKPSTHKKHKKIALHSPQQQLCIKTTSVHDYSELKYLKESLTSTQSMILIAKIKPIVSKYPQAEDKLVNELYSSNTVRENYSIFQLGEERIIIIPNIVQTKDVLL